MFTGTAPIERAISSRPLSAATPVTMTFDAPACSASTAQRMPIGPAPMTATTSPLFTGTRSTTACVATDSGSSNGATALSTPSGSGCTLRAGTLTNSVQPPLMRPPIRRRSSHSVGRPRPQ